MELSASPCFFGSAEVLCPRDLHPPGAKGSDLLLLPHLPFPTRKDFTTSTSKWNNLFHLTVIGSMKHLHNLSYLARHKWFVFLAGIKLNVPILALIVHDCSKLLPSEWFPYTNYFWQFNQNRIGKLVSGDSTGAYFHDPGSDVAFDTAWLKHIHRNPHHWQHWILREDEGATKILDMPYRYVLEMVADWMGAGRAQTGKWGVSEWYQKNKDNIRISDNTRKRVEEILNANRAIFGND